MIAKAAALFELMARAITNMIPTKGDPMKKTWATPFRIKFIVPEIGSIKITLYKRGPVMILRLCSNIL